ncbi:MAG: hypothetical protein AB7F32_03100 [Victivallaceae bacterium]
MEIKEKSAKVNLQTACPRCGGALEIVGRRRFGCCPQCRLCLRKPSRKEIRPQQIVLREDWRTMLFLIFWSIALAVITAFFIRQELTQVEMWKLIAAGFFGFGAAIIALGLAASRISLLLDGQGLTIRRRSLLHGFGSEVWRRGELASWRIRNAGASGGAQGLRMLRAVDLLSYSGRIVTLPYNRELLRLLAKSLEPASDAAAVCSECRTPFGSDDFDSVRNRYGCRNCGGDFAADRVTWVGLEHLDSLLPPELSPAPGCRITGEKLVCRIPLDWDFLKLALAVLLLSGGGLSMLISCFHNSPSLRGLQFAVVGATVLFLLFLPGYLLYRACRRVEFSLSGECLTVDKRIFCLHLKRNLELRPISSFEVAIIPHRGGADSLVLFAVRRDGERVKLAGGLPEMTLRFVAAFLNRRVFSAEYCHANAARVLQIDAGRTIF